MAKTTDSLMEELSKRGIKPPKGAEYKVLRKLLDDALAAEAEARALAEKNKAEEAEAREAAKPTGPDFSVPYKGVPTGNATTEDHEHRIAVLELKVKYLLEK